jgi:pimeloyl-ACP methyl ester carboxylesterase
MASQRSTVTWTMWAILLLAAGCRSVPVSVVRTSAGDPGVSVRGLTACGESGGELALDPARPLVLFVLERGDPGTRYRELAWRFEQDGRQAACFDHGDRESLEESSRRLIRAIEQLESRLAPSRIVVVGHSLGGLIARRALTRERPDALPVGGAFTYALVTVAAPFGGIRASADCGRMWLHALTLGTSALMCNLVAGEAWTETPPASPFIRRPGTLLPEVEEQLQIVTDERQACRRRAWDGSCLESDRLFSVGEQRNPAVERDARSRRILIEAGHREILGQPGIPPRKLIAVLESEGLLKPFMRVATP